MSVKKVVTLPLLAMISGTSYAQQQQVQQPPDNIGDIGTKSVADACNIAVHLKDFTIAFANNTILLQREVTALTEQLKKANEQVAELKKKAEEAKAPVPDGGK